MDYTDILIQPIVTEKSTEMKDAHNQVTFLVSKSANKIEVKQAVEKAFDVAVDNVNISSQKPRLRKRFGRTMGTKPGYKKAIIRLAPGDKIEYFEGV
jgi:large subunit ribosomal protein L23